MLDEYKHQQIAAFHAVYQRGRAIDEYEEEFYSLVHHVDYMAEDSRQAKRSLHGLDLEVHTKVAMWKPTTMAQTSSIARQVKKKIDMAKQEQVQAQAQSMRRNYRPIGTFQIVGRRDGYRGGHSGAIRRAKLSNISLTTFAATPPTARSRFEL